MINLSTYVNNLPPSSQNNAREIVKGKLERIIKRFPSYPSESLAREFEELTAICGVQESVDYRSSDYGDPTGN